MADQVNALQQSNRRVLERLRPVGLAELGLADALAALMRLWREANPDVVIETSISPSLGARGETAELTIYRVIQEALSNVVRHSGAKDVWITAQKKHGVLCCSVRDNGGGFRTEALSAEGRRGLGISSMNERLNAVGELIDLDQTPIQARAAAFDGSVQRVALRLVHYSDLPRAIRQEADGNRVTRIAVHVVQAAADRIDDPHRVGADRHLLIFGALFGQDGVVRKRLADPGHNGVLDHQRLGHKGVAAAFPGEVLVGCVDFFPGDCATGSRRLHSDSQYAPKVIHA